MATTQEIRRRINSTGNITQITRAMEMVSASKMRRAQQRVQASRPYSERLRTMIAGLSGLTDLETGGFPLLEQRPIERVGVILVTADKGLAGALNSNVLRRAYAFIRDEANAPVEVITVGRKGRDFIRKTNYSLAAEFTSLGDWPTLDDVRPIVNIAVDDYERGNVDAVHLIFTRFFNTVNQRPEVLQLLPIQRETGEIEAEEAELVRDFIFEPDRETVLQALLPRYVEVQAYQVILEALASEHSARMVAMRNATENANELLDELTLTYNKVRQAAITNEVSEIAAGAMGLGSA